MQYDGAGNLKKDTYTGAGDRTYDAENRMTKAWGGNGQWQEYSYNADGQRVRRKVNGTETWQAYGFGGELLAEYAASAAATSPQKEYGYRNGQLLITAEAAATPRTNVATTAAGATATAQNYTQDSVYPGYHWQPPFAIDGQRYSHLIADGSDGTGFWRDEHGLSSWLEVDFSGAQTIDEVDVFTVANYPALMTQADPPATQTFTQFGASAFTVQYWTGSAWATVPNGSISGNNLVWRKLNFAAITTTKIRVVVNAGVDGVARLAEVEAWTASSATNINWLVTDQLGTPRMVFDQTGTLAGVKRHDYLPFGEELFAGTGGRTATMGYSAADGVRRKFTSKERDNETGLDYFGARYYSSIQARFTSPDKPFADQFQTNPQSWNTYSYVRNSPCNNVDAKGRCTAPAGLKPGQVGICIEAFIAAATVSKFGLKAWGDGRSWAPNDPNAPARYMTHIIVSPQGDQQTAQVTQATTASVSVSENPLHNLLNKGPVLAVAQGTADTKLNGVSQKADGTSSVAVPLSKDGTAQFNVSTTGTNGFDAQSGVNSTGTIKTSLDLNVNTKSGTTTYDDTSSATQYPSHAIYSYVNNGKEVVTKTVLQQPERDVSDLNKPKQPLRSN
jgi:RHS repeat-associated protein